MKKYKETIFYSILFLAGLWLFTYVGFELLPSKIWLTFPFIITAGLIEIILLMIAVEKFLP